MGLAKAHANYADAVMLERAYKKLKRRGAPSSKSAEKASYDHTMANCFSGRKWDKERAMLKKKGKISDLKGLLPGGKYRKNTAKKVNALIEKESKRAIDKAVKKLKLASIDVETLTPAALFAVAASERDQTPSENGLSRRGMLAVLAGGVFTAAAVGTPSEAHAEDYGYVNKVKRDLQYHTTTNSKPVKKAIGIAIRASLDDDIFPKNVMNA